jgi:hypothetical protein
VPKLKAMVGDYYENQSEQNNETVDFMHPVHLRQRLEELFAIDANYMRVT